MKSFHSLALIILICITGIINQISAQTITISHQTSAPFYIGEIYPIDWSYTNLVSQTVAISISTDNGTTWITADTVDKDSNPYDFPILTNPTTQGRFRVSSVGSPATESISANPFQIKLPVYILTSLTGGQVITGCTNQTVNWTMEGVSTTVDLDLSPDGGTTWLPLTEGVNSIPGANSFTWSVSNIATASADRKSVV